MKFTITQSDYELMQQHVGGLNYNYATDPTLNADGRFTAYVKPQTKDSLNDLVKRLDAQIAQPPTDMIPIDVGPAIASSPTEIKYLPGRAQALPASIAGNGSASVEEGGAGLYAVVLSAPLPASIPISAFTAWGAKAVQGLAIAVGQSLIVYSEAATELPGRADVR